MDSATSHSLLADFLDDKLQTSAHLLQLDTLLAGIAAQHQLLHSQLHSARQRLDDAQNEARQHHRDAAHRAQAFHQAQADIDRRLQVITASETSHDAVPRFEQALDSLHRLDVASGYLGLLTEVDRLSSEAHTLIDANNAAVLEPYQQLRVLHTRLASLQQDAEGAAPQLLHHVATVAHALRTRILDAFSADLDGLLSNIHWPSPKPDIPPHLRDDWEAAIVRLLQLQMPELEGTQYAQRPGAKLRLPPVLFPLEVLVQPLEMRFRYHFDGHKPTNRIDRPEYFLSHITTLLNDYSAFVDAHIQPILLRHFRGTHLALNPVYIDATSAFITALLPMLRTRIGSLLPKVANEPQLLSHLMHEIMTFDTTIRDTWGYDGGFGVEGWKGLSWEVLVHGDWFGRWLQVEKDFALSRYQSIVDAPDFGDLDYDSVDPKATKPTKGAIRVNDLLETITDRYKPLTSFSQKLTFLIDIQIAIFDKLHGRLGANLDAYLTKTTSLGRAMGGVTKEEQEKLLGVEGLEQLCKTYGSADYLERAMRDWSDDVFFLDIWEGLQDRARDASSIGSMSVADVAERTSKSVESHGDGGSLFDETASWYAALRDKSEKIIIDTLNSNVREALRPYRHINPWATLRNASSASSALSPLSPTAEIDPLLAYLGRTLGFLARALASAPLRRITRSVVATISSTLWDTVLSRYRFSIAGAAQLRADLAAVCHVVNKPVGPGVAESGLRKCLEACQLIGLPIRGGKGESDTPSRTPEQFDSVVDDDNGDDNDWDAAWDGGDVVDAQADLDDPIDSGTVGVGLVPQKAKNSTGSTLAATSTAEAEDEQEQDSSPLGLWQVEKRLFADNQSARDVLDELGLDLLSEMEARMLLRQRVELAG